ncbi:MAG: hypothetical protein E6700_07585 [Winkia neuii]|uniref:Aldose 1-epimerase n=1 Tax=Winkia neuii TaxID=33007 RepID=A0A2I1IP65_9ACTO|nr:hypothetical protein [Winkia neuii]OFJ71391.1 hypothetical protein HMPREF2851_07600 [Actinomyces sp. HMSC064C12]OFK01454.1 hypothetical protein HMPREF2835_09490 [Actinomyces sp. HMSC072A03]KWZ72957.1 aldose 1-epimerase [Winkia neuii]MDK8100216.1 hypothetical protein [Winkia neuii]MDU3135416.1 hypothetical protein [Winkia neuii]
MNDWVITCADARASISAFRGVVTSWVIESEGRSRELLDGYRNEQELQSLDGYRAALMAPWSNRIEDARYSFGGKEYDLGADPSGLREALHGLYASANFELVGRRADSITIEAHNQGVPGYPWPTKLQATYTLREGGRLELELRCTNCAEQAIKVGLGWHPYLAYQGEGEAKVDIPARTQVKVDEALIPVPGKEAFVDRNGNRQIAFEGLAGIDLAYTNLVPDPDGVVRTRLTHPDGSVTTLEGLLEGGRLGCGIVHIFTGDTLRYRPGKSFAMEPCHFMTNAFNRAEVADEPLLQPGQTRVLRAALVHCPSYPQQD